MSNSDERGQLLAHRCPDGHATCPGHTVCPECGADQTETVELHDRTAEVITWTESVATPSGVRAPNTLAIVSFSLEGTTVQVLGQTTDDVEIGETVRPVQVKQLRDPSASMRARESQEWSGHRFEPLD